MHLLEITVGPSDEDTTMPSEMKRLYFPVTDCPLMELDAGFDVYVDGFLEINKNIVGPYPRLHQ